MPRKKLPAGAKEKPLMLNQLETAFCHFVLQGKGYREAAEAMGLDGRQGDSYAANPKVKEYLCRFTDKYLDGMVQNELAKAAKLGLSRESILQRLWYLANTPAHETRGSIDGQIQALSKLAELMGLTFDPKTLPDDLRRMTTEELQNFATTGKLQ